MDLDGLEQAGLAFPLHERVYALTPQPPLPSRRERGSRAATGVREELWLAGYACVPLTLHGHIHESPELSGRYAAQLGATWSINPGHDPRRFQAVTLDTDDLAGTIMHTTYGRPAL